MKMMTCFFIIISLFLNICPSFADSEDKEEKPIYDLGEIVVTATLSETKIEESPVHTSVISEEEFENDYQLSVPEILSFEAGVNIQSYGSLGSLNSLSLRGSNANQSLLLWDGIELNNSQNGNINFNQISLSDIEHIEVIRGSYSALYGSNAVGGVVNIFSKNPPAEEGFETQLSAAAGSHNTSLFKIGQGGRLGQLGYFLSADRNETDGYRINNDYYGLNGNLKLKYDFSQNNNLTLFGRGYEEELGAPGPKEFESETDRQNTKGQAGYIRFQHNFNTSGHFNLALHGQQDQMDFHSSWSDDKHNIDNFGIKTEAVYPISEKLKLAGGGEFQKESLDSSVVGEPSQQNSSIFLQTEWAANDKVDLLFGARADQYEDLDLEINPKFSFIISVIEELYLKGSLGRSFLVPSFNDLYWPESTWVSGNPDLKPETGMSYELGVEKYSDNGNSYFKIWGFWREMKDLIQWQSDLNYVWKPFNVAESRTQGIEIDFRKNFSILTYQFFYTHLWTEDKENEKEIPYKPSDSFSTSLDFDLPWQIILSFEGRYVCKQYIDVSNTDELNDYFILNTYLNKSILDDRCTFFFKGYNLTDQEYEAIKGYPMDAFNLMAGVEFKF